MPRCSGHHVFVNAGGQSESRRRCTTGGRWLMQLTYAGLSCRDDYLVGPFHRFVVGGAFAAPH
jgi:hypothetical protein